MAKAPHTDSQTPSTDKMIGTAVYGFVSAGIAAGLTPTRSMSLAAFGIIEGTLGRDAIRALGLPTATASDWRREIAAMAESDVEALNESDLDVAVMNELLPMLGLRDLRITRESPSD